jgi:hypothetical protein
MNMFIIDFMFKRNRFVFDKNIYRRMQRSILCTSIDSYHAQHATGNTQSYRLVHTNDVKHERNTYQSIR